MDINNNEMMDFLISKFNMDFKKLEYDNNYSNDIFIGFKNENNPILFVKVFKNVINFNKELYILKNFYSYRIVDVIPEHSIIVYNYINICKINISFFENDKFTEEFLKIIKSYHMKIESDFIFKNKLYYENKKLSEKLKEVFYKLSNKNKKRVKIKLKVLLQFSLIFDEEYNSLRHILIHGDLSLRNFGIVGDKLELFDFEHTRVGVLYEEFIKLYYRELKNYKHILSSLFCYDLPSKLTRAVILFKEALGIYLYCESNEDKKFHDFGKYLEMLSQQYLEDYLYEFCTCEIDRGMFVKAYVNNDIVLKKFYNYNDFYYRYRKKFVNSIYINKYIFDCKSINIPQPEINYSFEINNKVYLIQSYIKGITLYDFEKFIIKKIGNSKNCLEEQVLKNLFLYYRTLIVYLKNTYKNFKNLRIDLNTKNYIINSSNKLILVDYIPPIYVDSSKENSYYQAEYKYIYSNIYLQVIVMSLYIIKPLINDRNLKSTIRKKLIKLYLDYFDKITIDELGISNNELLNSYRKNSININDSWKNEVINNKIKNRIEGIYSYLNDEITIDKLNDIYFINSMKIENYD